MSARPVAENRPAAGEWSVEPLFDATKARIDGSNWADLTIPTSVEGNNEVVHPSVLFIPQGFGPAGHQYWMAITPLPIALGGTAQEYEAEENPEIFSSADGVAWSAPAGLTNPIAPDPDPSGSGHNADTYLVLDKDGGSLICVWLEDAGAGTERVQAKRSFDGVTWGDTFTLLSYSTSSERFLSPCLNWDAENSRYVLHGVDTTQANNTLVYCVRSDLDGAFGSRANCAYTLRDGELDAWHVDIRRVRSGKWFGVLMVGAAGGAEPSYAMDSRDGLTWQMGRKLSVRNGYKSSFVQTEQNTVFLYWGLRSGPDWHVELSRLRFNRHTEAINQRVNENGAAANALAKTGRYYLEDSFARGDNLTSLGTADSGESWAADSGELNVVSGQAKAASAANNISTVDVGFSNAEVIAEFSNLSSTLAYVVLRFSAASAMMRVGVQNNKILFQRIGGEGSSIIREVGIDSATSRKVRIICDQSRYELYADGTFLFAVVDDNHESNTKFGLQLTETGTTVDRIIVSRAP